MTTTLRRFVIAGLAAGVSAIMLSGVRAQDANHRGHDGSGAAATTVPKASAPTADPVAGKSDHRQMMQDKMQAKHKGMGGGGAMGSGAMIQAQGDAGPSSQAFKAISIQMHHAMAITFTGDADMDFAKAMIPHHQGAIDMAKVVLGFGKDPEIRKLAESVIKAQETEIAQMNAWLKSKAQ